MDLRKIATLFAGRSLIQEWRARLLRRSTQTGKRKNLGGFVLEIVLERGLFYPRVVKRDGNVKNRVFPS